jgi:hypothetical protein
LPVARWEGQGLKINTLRSYFKKSTKAAANPTTSEFTTTKPALLYIGSLDSFFKVHGLK